MIGLTKTQREILDYIEQFLDANRYAPTLQNIANAKGYKSLATVHRHLTNLEKKGFLKRGFNESHSMEVTVPDTIEARFRFEGKDRLWDNVGNCYWVKEQV